MNATIRKIKWRLLYPVKIMFFAVGKSWNDFYGWMLDYQDRTTTLEQIFDRRGPSHRSKGLWHWEKGEDYLEYMIKHGLKKNHRVFDLGCGYGRCTIPIMRFLGTKGHYVGSEISKKRLDLAREWVAKEKLENKSHELIFSKDLKLSFLEDDSLDIVWVFSVFNHMPNEVLEDSISAIAKKMKVGGKLFAFYVDLSAGPSTDVKFFPRADEHMEAVISRYGFTSKIMDDWESEYTSENRNVGGRMMISKKIKKI